MGDHSTTPPVDSTQAANPGRAVLRTVVQIVLPLAAGAPLIYQAATNHDPALAGGISGVILAVSAGLTRVMALPLVDRVIRSTPLLSWLAPDGQ